MAEYLDVKASGYNDIYKMVLKYEGIATGRELSTVGRHVLADAYEGFKHAVNHNNLGLVLDLDLLYSKHKSLIEGESKPLTAEDLDGLQGVPEVCLNVTWSAITADQVEKVAKFAAELGVPFNLNMQDSTYSEDEDDGELTHG